jgi:molybdate transport system permease protein
MAGTMLGFARALGEFGATVVVAGSIPGQTTTLSVAIYQAVQVGDDAFAYSLAGASAVLAFCAVLAGEFIFARRRN